MKILHVIPSVSPVRGGTSRAFIDMVRALQARGVDVEAVATNDDGDKLLDVKLGERTVYEGIPIYFFPRYSPQISPIREFAFSADLTRWLLQHLSDYDLIHVHALFSYPSTVAMALARSQAVPYLVTPHGLLCQWSFQQSAARKRVYLKAIERANLDRARSIHLTCQQELDDLTLLDLKAPTCVIPLALSEVPRIIPNARSLLCEMLSLPAEEPIILFLSRLHYKKGLEYLIWALGKLRSQRFRLVIAGSGSAEYEAKIREQTIAAKIEDRTEMVGFVAGERKQILIQGADLFALTSHSENFGLSVLESLVVGTPVLVTPGVGLATVVRAQNLGYVADLDIDEIAASLSLFFTDPAAAKQKGDRAREFSTDNFTWDKIATELVRVYAAIIAERNTQTN